MKAIGGNAQIGVTSGDVDAFYSVVPADSKKPRSCALKCPVFRKREGGYSVERGSVTGWTVIASGNSCSTSSPGSRISLITAWCCASASLQVEQRHCSLRNVRSRVCAANRRAFAGPAGGNA
jgi:hypothetical protein